MTRDSERRTHFTGQHAVVTGGGSGIGAAIAAALAGAGARVTIMGRNKGKLDAKASELGVAAQQIDVSKPDEVRRAFAKAVNESGPVTIAVNSAGVAESAPFSKTEAELWQYMLAVNLHGVYNCIREVIADMKAAGWGRIVNISSTAGLTGYAYVSAYCAAKHGVIGLTRALAIEFARTGVTVNSVCPGYTNTDIVTQTISNISRHTKLSHDEALLQLTNRNPQSRLIEPDEVSETVLWLCGPNSSSVTGQAIVIAGGEIM